uniref:GDSL esterase/lipase LIP-4 n=1 Tax=Cajanus cajan TaxID=3821 RepID=A0A151TX63_CAJCA|nr:GDSL esterase/lipase LIP-4 [Cajanus cajan]
MHTSVKKPFGVNLNHPLDRDQVTSFLLPLCSPFIEISCNNNLGCSDGNMGFSNPLMACCGFGGPPYNFDARVPCGQTGYEVCHEGSRYVSWDGIHYTEAANTLIASGVLSMAYSTPRTPFNFFCRRIAIE